MFNVNIVNKLHLVNNLRTASNESLVSWATDRDTFRVSLDTRAMFRRLEIFI